MASVKICMCFTDDTMHTPYSKLTSQMHAQVCRLPINMRLKTPFWSCHKSKGGVATERSVYSISLFSACPFKQGFIVQKYQNSSVSKCIVGAINYSMKVI